MTTYFSTKRLFAYTITNTTPYVLDSNDYSILESVFNRWDELITPDSRFEGFEYTIEVAIRIETLALGILGGASIANVYYFGDLPLRFGDMFPATGNITLNYLYISELKNSLREGGKSEYYYVMLHEVGHILGIGPFWGYSGAPIVSYLDAGITKYYYTGVNALREYKSYFSPMASMLVGIPIEDDGGSGTAFVHPEEGTESYLSSDTRMINGIWHPGLDTELMTGWLDAGPAATPLSRITLGFLEDMGYGVNYNLADYYRVMSEWLDLSYASNCFKQTYVQGFLDISGGSITTRGTDHGLVIGGDSSLNGTVYLGDSMYIRSNGLVGPNNSRTTAALYVNGNTDLSGGLTVSGDVSINALFVAGDLSINGVISVANFAANSVSAESINSINEIQFENKLFVNTRDISYTTLTGIQTNNNKYINEISQTYQKVPGSASITDQSGISLQFTSLASGLTLADYTWNRTCSAINETGTRIVVVQTCTTTNTTSNNDKFTMQIFEYDATNQQWLSMFYHTENTNVELIVTSYPYKPCDMNDAGDVVIVAIPNGNNHTIKRCKYNGTSWAFITQTSTISTYYPWLSLSGDGNCYAYALGVNNTIGTQYYIRSVDTNADYGTITKSEISYTAGIRLNYDGTVLIMTYFVRFDGQIYYHVDVLSRSSSESSTWSTTLRTYSSTASNIFPAVSTGFATRGLDINNAGDRIIFHEKLTDVCVYQYSGSGTSWTKIGTFTGGQYNSVSMDGTGNRITLSKDGTFSIYDYSGSGSTWNLFNNTAITDTTTSIGRITNLSANGTRISTSGFGDNSTVSVYEAGTATTFTNIYQKIHSDLTAGGVFASNTDIINSLTVPANIAIVDGSNGTVYGSYLTLTNKAATAYYNVGKSASGLFNIVDQSNAGVYLTAGGTSFTGTSDARLKTNIAPLESATDKIMALNPCTYQWKSDVDDTNTNEKASTNTNTKTHIGFIAQEVEQVMPELVHPIDHPAGPDYKGVNTTDLIPYLVRTIQEQKERIRYLSREISELEAGKP